MSDDAVEKVVPETGGVGTGEETLEPLHVLDEEEREGGSGKREREEESGANGEAKKLKTDGKNAGSGSVQLEIMTVPNDAVGLVIGKKGANIREFEQRSGAKMKVTPNDEWKGKTEPRPIKITGPNSARSYAKGLIYETLENSDIKPPAEESQIETIEIPQDSVGLVIGKKGASIKEFETKSGAKIKVASNEENKGKAERTVTIEGICSARNYAKGLVYETLEIAAGVTADQKKGAGKQGSDFIFHISNDAIGLLIGKGGSTIKNIENSFGVRVQIDKTTPAGATKRQITLVGNPAGAKMAKAQIESIINGVSIPGNASSSGGPRNMMMGRDGMYASPQQPGGMPQNRGMFGGVRGGAPFAFPPAGSPMGGNPMSGYGGAGRGGFSGAFPPSAPPPNSMGGGMGGKMGVGGSMGGSMGGRGGGGGGRGGRGGAAAGGTGGRGGGQQGVQGAVGMQGGVPGGVQGGMMGNPAINMAAMSMMMQNPAAFMGGGGRMWG